MTRSKTLRRLAAAAEHAVNVPLSYSVSNEPDDVAVVPRSPRTATFVTS